MSQSLATDIPQRLFAIHVSPVCSHSSCKTKLSCIVTGEETEAAGQGGWGGMEISDSLVGVVLVGSSGVLHPYVLPSCLVTY